MGRALNWRFEAYGGLALELFGSIGSFASVLGIVLALHGSWPWWAWALLAAGVVLLVTSILTSLLRSRGRRAYSRSDAAGIGKYMRDWILHGGRVAIWTRNHSWVDPDMEEVLLNKARQRELTVCLPLATPFATQLEREGAEVLIYGERTGLPASRFTIVNYERNGARVAVGRQLGELHVIDEFAADEHPAFHMAHDLVRLARQQSAVAK